MKHCLFCNKELIQGSRNGFITFQCPKHYCADVRDGLLAEERYPFLPEFILAVSYGYLENENGKFDLFAKHYSIKYLNVVKKRNNTAFTTDRVETIREFDIPNDRERLKQKLETLITFQ